MNKSFIKKVDNGGEKILMKRNSLYNSNIKTITGVFFVLLCTACSSVPPPTEQMAVAQTAVDSATSSGGAEYAAIEMKAAQDKLTAAKLAMEKEEYDQARRLAEQAQVDAKLAETIAESSKAQNSDNQTQQGLQTLQNELNRKNQNPSQ